MRRGLQAVGIAVSTQCLLLHASACSSGLEDIEFVAETVPEAHAGGSHGGGDPDPIPSAFGPRPETPNPGPTNEPAGSGGVGGSEPKPPMGGSDPGPPAGGASSGGNGNTPCEDAGFEVDWSDASVSRARMPGGDLIDFRLDAELPDYADQGHLIAASPKGAPPGSWLSVYTNLSRDLRLQIRAQTQDPAAVALGRYAFKVFVGEPTGCSIGQVNVTLSVTD